MCDPLISNVCSYSHTCKHYCVVFTTHFQTQLIRKLFELFRNNLQTICIPPQLHSNTNLTGEMEQCKLEYIQFCGEAQFYEQRDLFAKIQKMTVQDI